MKTILVPLDGSSLSEQVLPYVRLLAPMLTARVHLLIGITEAQKQLLITHFAAATVELVPLTVQSLLAHPERLVRLRECAQGIGRPHAALDIAEAIVRDLRGGIPA